MFLVDLCAHSAFQVVLATLAFTVLPRKLFNILDRSRGLGCFTNWKTPPPPVTGAAVIITGAGTGLGKATALRLAKAGWTVYAGVISLDEGRELVKECSPDTARNLLPTLLDVRDVHRMREVIQEISLSTHRLVGVVSNANIMSATGPIEYVDVESGVEKSFDVGVRGALRLVQASLPLLRVSSSCPRIVLVSSGAGSLTVPFHGVYSMTKAALSAFGDAMRRELNDVLISIIEPTMISTDTAVGWPDLLDNALSKNELARIKYRDMRDALVWQHFQLIRDGLTADQVARGICHALWSPQPAIRYRVGAGAQFTAILGSLCPASIADTILVLSRGQNPFSAPKNRV